MPFKFMVHRGFLWNLRCRAGLTSVKRVEVYTGILPARAPRHVGLAPQQSAMNQIYYNNQTIKISYETQL